MQFHTNSNLTKRRAAVLLVLLLTPSGLLAQRDRITGAINNSRRVFLNGHVHPLARAEFDQGVVDPSLNLPSLMLMLKPSASQQADLDQLLGAQQDASSPDFHRWLTPEQYADRFGASSADIAKVTEWLEAQGFYVTGTARARNWISFTGTAGQVASAFGAEIHRYDVRGELHIASSTEPSVPEALGVIVRGIRGMNDFRMKPLLKPRTSSGANLDPAYTSTTSGNHYMSPDDFATVYNVKPLYGAGIDGTGQKLVVAGQTQINLSDIEQYRTKFNLPANDPQVVLVPNTRDPGLSSSDLPEADLDLELSGAVAPNASVLYVYSFDVMDAVQYAIDQNLAPVISTSYGLCETETPNSDALTFQSWARQGNAQGITWFAASGDSGGADCIGGRDTSNAGPAVDVPASIPEVTGLGGTEFNEGGGVYWNSTNNINGGSVLSYIPETVWNDSTAGNPSAGGGGASVMFLKPSWQSGAGVPNDNARDVPDISLASSAEHDGFLIYSGGQLAVYGGTSVAAPSFAGIATLLNHYLVSTGAQPTPGLGNINPKLYGLAQTSANIFHDVTTGNNIVEVTCGARSRNCTAGSFGFNAGPGYDLASGLGSVDAHALAAAWTGQSGSISRSTPAMTLASGAPSILSSGSTTVTATITGSNGITPSGNVTFAYGSASLGSATLSGASGTAAANLTVSGAQLPLGADTISAQYSGDTSYNTATATTSINVTASTSGTPTISAMANAASFRQTFAPGMAMAVFGSALAPSTWSAASVPLPLQLAGVSVAINGVNAPLYYVSASQLNIQIPFETPANSVVTLQVNNNGQTVTKSLTTAATAPGIFTNAAGALVPAGSASVGQVVSLYMTGQGAVSPSIATGAAPPLGTSVANLPAPVQAVTVSVGGGPAQTQFVGIPPTLVGVMQINFVVPAGVARGAQAVTVSSGGVTSAPATLNIQ